MVEPINNWVALSVPVSRDGDSTAGIFCYVAAPRTDEAKRVGVTIGQRARQANAALRVHISKFQNRLLRGDPHGGDSADLIGRETGGWSQRRKNRVVSGNDVRGHLETNRK